MGIQAMHRVCDVRALCPPVGTNADAADRVGVDPLFARAGAPGRPIDNWSVYDRPATTRWRRGRPQQFKILSGDSRE